MMASFSVEIRHVGEGGGGERADAHLQRRAERPGSRVVNSRCRRCFVGNAVMLQ